MSPLSIPFSLSALRAASAGLRPPVAIALGPEGVVAGTAGTENATIQIAGAALSAGVIHPSIVETNLTQPAETIAAIRAALAGVEPRGRAATMIVPDAAVRIFLLDFDTFPTRRDEALPILRFRLRKSVSFDVEHAGVSFQILSEGSARTQTPWKIMAILMPGAVREEYEGVARAAGLEPGVVLPASLASLCPLHSQQAELIAFHSRCSLTIAIVSGSDFLLHRTSDLSSETGSQRTEIQRAIAVSCAFFEDTLRAAPSRILYAGALPRAEFATIINEASMTVEPMVDLAALPNATGIADHLSGLASTVVAALTGAR